MNHIKIKSLNKILGLWLILTMTMVLSAAPIKIMLLGDSITEGGGEIPDRPEQNISAYTGGLIQGPEQIGYRGKLWSLLTDAGYTFGTNGNLDFVGNRNSGSTYPVAFDMDHQGASGFKSSDVRDNIEMWLTSNPADIVLLHIGTNDPGNGIDIGTYDDPDENNNTTVNNVKKILNTIFSKNPNTKVFLARIIEARRAHSFAEFPNWRTVDLNNAVVEMANNHPKSANISIVDMESGAGIVYNPCGTTLGDMQPFHSGSYIEYDFHPNYKGYEKMAQKWSTALQASGYLVPTTTTTAEHLWHLNETSAPFVDSEGANNASCTGTECPTQTTGKIDKALIFDGTNKLTVAANASLDFTANESYTIEFWMKADNYAGNHVAIGRGTSSIGYLWLGADANKVKFEVPGGPSNQSSLGSITFGVWTHVALVKDANQEKVFIYLNGTLDSEYTSTKVAVENTPITIGSLNDGHKFHGTLDEMAIYRSALSGAEIQTHFLDQSGANDTPPVIAEVTDVQTPTNDSTPGYIFITTKAGNISYAGGCTSSTSEALLGNNIIIFEPLSNGTYNSCTLTVTDTDAQVSNILNITSFEINTNLATTRTHLWSLDESSTPFSNSENANEATCTGIECPTQVAGQVQNAQYFSGEQVLRITADTALNFSASESYSFEFWMKPEGNTTEGNEVAIHYGNLWIGRRDDQLKVQIPGGPSNMYSGALTVNNWNHIVVVKDASEEKIFVYINGSESNSFPSTASALNSAQLYLGDYNPDANATTYDFHGGLDEVAVYAGALSATEVQAHFHAQSTVDTTPPVIAEVTAVSTPTNNATPSYSFSSTEAGTITYGGTCTSANTAAAVGNNTITFITLANGTYSDCTITVTDAVNNVSAVLAVTAFEVNTTAVTNTAPSITLLGENTVNLTVGDTYTDAGATANDAEDGNITGSIVVGGDTVDTATVGTYTVTYNVNDSNGTAAGEVTRTVIVTAAPNTAPSITLLGESTVTLTVGDTYIDAGATANDAEDGNITGSIAIVNPVDSAVAGTYTVTYNVNDTNGTAAGEVTRTVIVTAANGNLDANNNGIPDAQEKEWFNYNKNVQKATITPINGGLQSELSAVGIVATPTVVGNKITLNHTVSHAYVTADEHGQVETGFNTDSTLKKGTFFKAGTKTVMKKENEKIIIETSVKLAKNELITIGGK